MPLLEKFDIRRRKTPAILNVSMHAMRQALPQLKTGRQSQTMDFEALKKAVGFPIILMSSSVIKSLAFLSGPLHLNM
ncbi:MAG: hypothetical protein AXA67_03300 [Methylothermaceae bacteria B42]|nr:MAG: hypothetical protein AXA67_03300 [Methylothermaceae bacteria B42]